MTHAMATYAISCASKASSCTGIHIPTQGSVDAIHFFLTPALMQHQRLTKLAHISAHENSDLRTSPRPFLFKPYSPVHNRTLHALSNDGGRAESSLTSVEYAFPSVRGQESRSLPSWLLSVASRQEKSHKRSRKTRLSPFLFPWRNTPTNPDLLFSFLIVFPSSSLRYKMSLGHFFSYEMYL